jgi:predicted acetyltransferase
MDGLTLRPLSSTDEAAAVAAHRELACEGVVFLHDYDEGMRWDEYLAKLERTRTGSPPPGRVRETFLVAAIDQAIVGRTSIRHELNAFLATVGGHIGYVVRQDYRGHGYATEILRKSLAVAHDAGIRPVLITCDDDNTASARAIERCGGVLESIVSTDDGTTKRRYWIA